MVMYWFKQDPNEALFNRNDIQDALKKERAQRISDNYQFNSEAFNQYLESRKELSNNLEKVFGDKPDHQEIIQNEDVKLIFSAPSLNDTADKFKSEVANFQKTIKERGNIQPVLEQMKKTIDLGMEAINTQQNAERDALRQAIRQSFDGKASSEDQIKSIEDDMIHILSKKHEEQKKIYADLTIASQREAHQAIQKDMDNHYFLTMLAKDYDKMGIMINKALEQKRIEFEDVNPTHGVTLSTFTDDTPDINMGYLKLSDFSTIYTKTHGLITQQNGTFTLAEGFPTGNIYMLKGSIKNDLRTMAEAVKASGKDSITIDVNFFSSELAMERAKQSYQAAIEAGFPPDKITMRIKNNIKTAEEIFGKGSPKLEHIHERVHFIQEQDSKTKVKIENDPFETKEYKKEYAKWLESDKPKVDATKTENKEQSATEDTTKTQKL